MAGELERLEAMYAELGEEHLRDLAAEPEELTDEARLALTREMRRRGWTAASERGPEPVVEVEEERQSGFGAAIPGVVPAGASAVEQALEPGGESRQGMARLLSFYDGLELTRACEMLEDAGLEPAIEEVAGDAMSGLPPHFEVWVGAGDEEAARRVLRAGMGLFPLAEAAIDQEEEAGETEAEGDLVVAEFGSQTEAEGVRRMLVQAGFAARVEGDRLDGAVSVVVVPAEQQERALELVAERMGLE